MEPGARGVECRHLAETCSSMFDIRHPDLGSSASNHSTLKAVNQISALVQRASLARKMEPELTKLEGLMTRCKHRIWGFVIYRSAYQGPNSDTDFAKLMQYLKGITTDTDEYYGNQPIFQKLEWSLFEDRNTLENATNAQIKKRFDEWCRSDAAASEQPESLHPISQSPLARYQFCLHVDQASLDSILPVASNSSDPGFQTTAFVNIVARGFPQGIPEEYLDDSEDDEDGEEDEQYPPIEGSTEPDVGWCKLPVNRIYPGSYIDLCDNESWFHFYVRPPALVGSRRGLTYYGF